MPSEPNTTPEPDDTPVWIVEVWQKKDGHRERFVPAVDFKKGGTIQPVLLDKAIQVAHKRQKMRDDYVYRVRNTKTGAVIMAAIL